MVAWTQASDPTNTNLWIGGCNSLDIFIPVIPKEPPDFDIVSTYNNGQLFILEGMEFPLSTYTAGVGSSIWQNGVTLHGLTISTSVRDTTKTGGHSLQVAASTTDGSYIEWPHKPTGSQYQYFRAYFNITNWTNGSGFRRSKALFGWTDSTGFRSIFNVIFPATVGTLPKFSVSCELAGGAGFTETSSSYSLNTWYRVEMVTETVSGVGTRTTANIYLGDTTTVLESISYLSSVSAAGGFPLFGIDTLASGNAITVLFDDIRIQTTPNLLVTETASNAPLWGPGGIWAMYPRTDVTSEWTPLSGSNFENVDEFPLLTWDGDTSYITGTGASALLDTYRLSFHPSASFPTANKAIKAVMVHQYQKNQSGTARAVNAVYSDVFDTNYTGSNYVTSGAGYQGGSVAFLIYDPTLRIEFASEQKIGTYWTASGVAASHRVTGVWGLMDIVDV